MAVVLSSLRGRRRHMYIRTQYQPGLGYLLDILRVYEKESERTAKYNGWPVNFF